MAGALVPGRRPLRPLEVAADASSEAIEVAWRALLKQHHPDVAGDGAAALERAKRINVAHDWLSDPALRARYDRGAPGARRDPGGPRTHRRPARAAAARRPPQPAPRPASAARPGAPRARTSSAASPPSGWPRFLDRVERLTPDELDRLAAAEPPPIAFLATVQRFLTARRRAPRSRRRRRRWPCSCRTIAGPRSACARACWAWPRSSSWPRSSTTCSRSRSGAARATACCGRGRPRSTSRGTARTARRWWRCAPGPRLMTPDELARSSAPRGRARRRPPWPAALDRDEDEALRISALLAAARRRRGAAGRRARPGDRGPGSPAAGAHRPRDRAPPRLPGADLRRARRPRSGWRPGSRPPRTAVHRMRRRPASVAPADRRRVAAAPAGRLRAVAPRRRGLAAILLMISAAACAPASGSSTPSTAPSTTVGFATPSTSSAAPSSPAAGVEFASTRHGYRLTVPAGWTVTETPGTAACTPTSRASTRSGTGRATS